MIFDEVLPQGRFGVERSVGTEGTVLHNLRCSGRRESAQVAAELFLLGIPSGTNLIAKKKLVY